MSRDIPFTHHQLHAAATVLFIRPIASVVNNLITLHIIYQLHSITQHYVAFQACHIAVYNLRCGAHGASAHNVSR